MRTRTCLAFLSVVAIVLLAAPRCAAASYDKAVMLHTHGLSSDAKRELIDLIFEKGTADAEKARAYQFLGRIAFEENRIAAALDTWRELVAKFPDSTEAASVKPRLVELSTLVGDTARETVDDVLALSYLHHADFWSRAKDESFTIDASWLSGMDAAVKWYDKVIAEFPKSKASRLAYEGKIRTLLGWGASRGDGEAQGAKADFDKYMPLAVGALTAFEKEHPDAPTLQAFRYQIAQAYWGRKRWVEARQWLQKVIAADGGGDGFYGDLAKRRMQRLEF
jgi:tetratricopeptide (TPR) repeat protein